MSAARSPSARSAEEPAPTSAATAATPSSASTRPAASSESNSGTISAPASKSPVAGTSPPSPKSSPPRLPDRHDRIGNHSQCPHAAVDEVADRGVSAHLHARSKKAALSERSRTPALLPLLPRQGAIGHRDRSAEGVAGARGFRPGGLSHSEWRIVRSASPFAIRYSPSASYQHAQPF